MKVKTLAWVVAVLAVLAVVTTMCRRAATGRPVHDPLVGTPLFGGEMLGAARTVRVAGNGSTVTLRRASETEWTVAEYHDLPADFHRMAGLFARLGEARITRLITTNPERIGRLDFKGERIELLDADGRILRSVELGGVGEAGGSFIRLADPGRAYMTDFIELLPFVPFKWVETALTPFAASDIASIEIGFEGMEVPVLLSRSGDGWAAAGLPTDRLLNGAEAEGLARRIAGIKFTDVCPLDDPGAVAARSNVRKLRATLKDGTWYDIAIGQDPSLLSPDAGRGGAQRSRFVPAHAFIRSSIPGARVNALMERFACQVEGPLGDAIPASVEKLLVQPVAPGLPMAPGFPMAPPAQAPEAAPASTEGPVPLTAPR